MKKLVFLVPFLVVNAFSNSASYFPADIEKAKASILNISVPYQSEPIDISLYTRRPMSGFDSLNQISEGSQIILPSNLDQIYESFRSARTLETEGLFSSDGHHETMTMENPEAVQIKAALMELIQLKMQERLSGGFGESETSKAEKEMIEVRVKKEGEVERKIKVKANELKKAVEEETVTVQGDEIVSPKLPTDYNGKDTWAVKSKTEAGVCLFCLGKEEKFTSKLEMEATNKLILETYAKYSKDPKTAKMIAFAKEKKLGPEEYSKTKLKWCYRYVKNALLHAKLTSKRLEGALARNSGDKLRAEGFINIMEDPKFSGKITSPSQAPKGAILVYEPNPVTRLTRTLDDKGKKSILAPDAGHIEIKTEDVGVDGYVSEYYSKNARTGKGLVSEDRKLIGIYVKK